MVNPFKRPNGPALASQDLGIVSPWAPANNLAPWIATDLFGEDWPAAMPLTREQALAIPAVSKVRNLLTSVIADLPLKALNKDGELAEQPTWLYRSDTDIPPYIRMAMTVDDLIFAGEALWAVSRGAQGQITDAMWIPRSRWTTTNGNILVDEQPVDSREVIYFIMPGYSGILTQGNESLRSARDLQSAVARNLRNPLPAAILKQTENTGEVNPADAAALLTQWRAARKDPDGAVAFLPYGIDLNALTGSSTSDTAFLEAQNAMVTTVGQLTSVRAAMLDGTASIDSLTYTTKDGEKNAFYEFDLPFWTSPIEARLSMDDVVPRGQRVRFDKSEVALNPTTPTGAPVED